MARCRAGLEQTRSFGEQLLKRLHVVPAREFAERLAGVPSGQISLQHTLQQSGHLVERDAFEDHAADARLGARAAPEDDVVTLDSGRADLHAQQSDVPNVMLRTRVRAAGEVNIDGLVERNALTEMLGKLHRLTLRVGGGPLA